jgi:nitrogen regulatory protein PII
MATLADRENIMNVFEEFRRLVSELEKQRVRYALVGGVAMAFYTEPRFTRDIDILVDPEDFQKAKDILEKNGYSESASPWTFRTVAIELHRFLKVANEEDEMLIDILVAKDEEVRKVIQNAVEAESEEGRVMLANKEDLIWLKRTRDSKQDQADIEKLEDEKNR